MYKTRRSANPRPLTAPLAILRALRLPAILSCLLPGVAGTALAQPEQDQPALRPATLNLHPGQEYSATSRLFQGIPGIARAPGGRLWATWYSGGKDEGPDNYVVLVTSGDDGHTWTEVQAVVDPEYPVRAFDPCVWVDPRGRLWWFYAQAHVKWDGRGGVWAVRAENPDQAQPTWTQPRRISDGIMMNKPTVLRNGDWLLPVAVWTHGERVRALPPSSPSYVPAPYLILDPRLHGAHVYRSRDQGATFERWGTAQEMHGFTEHMLVERQDGNLWMLARSSPRIKESVSTDGGRTWTPGQLGAIPHISSRFFIRRLQSGKLLLVKHNPPMDIDALRYKRAPTSWDKRSHLTAYLSDDDGDTWSRGLVLDERPSVSYPDGDEAPDGRIYLIYDRLRRTEKEILMAVFTEGDVEAGTLVSSGSRFRVLVNKATGRP